MKKPLIIKLALALVALALFGFLFMRSLEDTRSAPYTIEAQHLRSWTLALESASGANEPLLVLQPVPELASVLFRQVFARAMESLNAPVAPAIPIVLRGEFDRVVGDQLTQEALLTAARAAGLERASITPRCIVHRRISEPGGTKQAYLVFFDAPAIARFRQQLGLDPHALSPTLFIAGAGADPNSWLPQRVSIETDCQAPIEVAS
ncbi:MAG TPA: hypothetical protein VJM31_08480 [Vicinamibacterales bacterium]|nr:hypothetical protein [Vicinamibacterales bacterium]